MSDDDEAPTRLGPSGLFDGLPEQGQAIMTALARELNPAARTWGEPPEVLILFDHEGRVRARGMGLPAIMWAFGETSDILAGIAEAAESFGPAWRPLVPPGLIGCGVRCEVWTVRDLGGPELIALTAGQVRGHPDATRGRFTCAVDRSGITYSVETCPEGHILGGRYIPPGDRITTASGAIPEALDRLLTALLGVRLPIRLDPWTYPDNPERNPR